MKNRYWLVLAVALSLSIGSAYGVTRLQKLADNRYLVTVKKLSGWGGEGRVLRKLNERVASLCVITGHKWFGFKDQTSHGRGFFKTAAGTAEVVFYHEEEEGLTDCEALATEEEKRKMARAYKNATGEEVTKVAPPKEDSDTPEQVGQKE